MLKSTHKPTVAPGSEAAPLPEGWTEHKAPTGHSYYYHAATKKSTYTRPAAPIPPPPQVPIVPAINPSLSFLQYQNVPEVGHGGPPHIGTNNADRGGFSHRGGRGGRSQDQPHRPRGPQPTDKPKSKHEIPGCSPWILVHTKLERRFVYNPEKNASYWRIPDKLKAGILELDQQRIREKAGIVSSKDKAGDEEAVSGASERPGAPSRTSAPAEAEAQAEPQGEAEPGDDSSEYEEVEVTDDENEEDDDDNNPKRQRTGEEAPDGPVEFNEDDIAFQLAAMGEDYGLDPGEYDDGHMEDWVEGAAGLELSDEDATALFTDLLNDFNINPYSPWEKLLEEGRLVNDGRYTALPTTKARKEVWEIWSKAKIAELKAQRAKEEKKDPRIPYLAFLQENATPKLYWPEFKRKFKKAPEMRDQNLTDKNREKAYREYISRLKLPASQLKTEFLALLKDQPLTLLNNKTHISHLSPTILTDIRYISITPSIRDPLLTNYISTLPPPPSSENGENQQETEEEKNKRKEKERREAALKAREEMVEEEKKRQEKRLRFGKGRLREEEEEIRRAMEVGKKGLIGHLIDADVDEGKRAD